MRVNNESNTAQITAEQNVGGVEGQKGAGRTEAVNNQRTETTVEEHKETGAVSGQKDPGGEILSGLFEFGKRLFSSGADRSAIGAAAIGGFEGGDVDLLQFAMKAVGMLLKEPTPEGFIKTGIELAQDPNFGKVLAKLLEVTVDLAGKAAGAAA